MKYYYITDKGLVRSHNEDAVTVVENLTGEHILIVADGMGGHRAGEVASSIAVSHLSERFKTISSIGNKLDAINWLDDNVKLINMEIIKYAASHPECMGMGTTLVVAILTSDFLIFGNIGDSSGFVLKNGKLHKVTKDHTLVSVLVDAGDITEEEALTHPKKNVLMKALGVAEEAELDKFTVDSEVDAIFLCSDGLTNMLSVEQIENILNDEALDIDFKLSKLIRKCNSRGGTDNISIAYLVKESK